MLFFTPVFPNHLVPRDSLPPNFHNKMKILNFGSLNIDHVYQVDHISRPGETLSSHAYQLFAGGKGANQSAALARAGATVFHAGRVGPEGQWLLDKLTDLGADMRFTRMASEPTGHAIIQVDADGQNSIVLFPGANHQVTRPEIETTLETFNKGDILLLQNEIKGIPYLMKEAKKRGLKICFNPAPFSPEVLDYPLASASIIVVNETEGMGLAAVESTDRLMDQLAIRWPDADIVLTLGSAGARYRSAEGTLEIPAVKVDPVDTTGAGDTFIGFFLAGLAAGSGPQTALNRAARAAALCVTRPGAMDSIPTAAEVEEIT